MKEGRQMNMVRTGRMLGGVAGLVGIESGVVSGLLNPNDSALGSADGDHAMERTITKPAVLHAEGGASAQLFEDWFDPIESAVRAQVRHFIEGLIEAE